MSVAVLRSCASSTITTLQITRGLLVRERESWSSVVQEGQSRLLSVGGHHQHDHLLSSVFTFLASCKLLVQLGVL